MFKAADAVLALVNAAEAILKLGGGGMSERMRLALGASASSAREALAPYLQKE